MSDEEVDELLKAVDTSSGEINYTGKFVWCRSREIRAHDRNRPCPDDSGELDGRGCWGAVGRLSRAYLDHEWRSGGLGGLRCWLLRAGHTSHICFWVEQSWHSNACFSHKHHTRPPCIVKSPPLLASSVSSPPLLQRLRLHQRLLQHVRLPILRACAVFHHVPDYAPASPTRLAHSLIEAVRQPHHRRTRVV